MMNGRSIVNQFYKELGPWVDGGCGDHPYFTPVQALCSNFVNFLIRGGHEWASVEDRNTLFSDAAQVLDRDFFAFLGMPVPATGTERPATRSYPFNIDLDDPYLPAAIASFTKEGSARQHWENPRRLAFVRWAAKEAA